MPEIKYLIADSQRLFAEGFEGMLKQLDAYEMINMGIALSGKELMQLLELDLPTVLFMDLSFDDIEGVELIKATRKVSKDIHIVIVSAYTDHKLVKIAFQNGVDGFYSKYNSFSDLSNCLDSILKGNTYLGEGLYITPPQKQKLEIVNGAAKRMEDRFIIKQKLTKREHEILLLITKALNNKEIAKELFISDQTVGVHRKNIMRKLGVRNSVSLIKFALENQLV